MECLPEKPREGDSVPVDRRLPKVLNTGGPNVSERKAFHGVSWLFNKRTLASIYFCEYSGGYCQVDPLERTLSSRGTHPL